MNDFPDTQELFRDLDQLRQDSHRAWVMIGALIGAVSELPTEHRDAVIKSLDAKARALGDKGEPITAAADALRT